MVFRMVLHLRLNTQMMANIRTAYISTSRDRHLQFAQRTDVRLGKLCATHKSNEVGSLDKRDEGVESIMLSFTPTMLPFAPLSLKALSNVALYSVAAGDREFCL